MLPLLVFLQAKVQRGAAAEHTDTQQQQHVLHRSNSHSLANHGSAAACWPRCALQALALYQELLHQDDPDPLYHTYSAACCYYMGLTQEAAEAAAKVLFWKTAESGRAAL